MIKTGHPKEAGSVLITLFKRNLDEENFLLHRRSLSTEIAIRKILRLQQTNNGPKDHRDIGDIHGCNQPRIEVQWVSQCNAEKLYK